MKRKILIATIIGLLIAFPVSAGIIAYTLHPAPYPVLVNGAKLNSNLPTMTYKANGGDNTYVPLKAVLDIMGAKTTWDGKSVNVSVGPDPAKVANSVVEIYVSKNGQCIGQGSGVLIDYDEILTCSHVAVAGDSYQIIYNDGHTTTAVLKKDKPSEDAAILEPAEKNVKPVKIGDSEEIGEGDKIFLVSSPKEQKNVISQGVILHLYKNIYTSAKGDFGSSGGGLFSSGTGELIGIITSGNKTTSKETAIKINDIRQVLSN